MPYEDIQVNEVGRPSGANAYSPTTVPKWDVLQRERIVHLQELDLDYRTQPVLKRKDDHFVILIIGLIGFVCLLTTPLVALIGPVLDSPMSFAVLTAFGIGSGIVKFVTQRIKWVAVAHGLSGIGLWTLAVLPHWLQTHGMLRHGLFLIGLVAVVFWVRKVGQHYAAWLCASPQLIGEKREQAKALWKSDDREGMLLIALMGGMGLLFYNTFLFGLSPMVWITLVSAGVIAYRVTGFQRMRETLGVCWAALVSWFTYARYQAVHFDFVEGNPYQGTGSGLLALFLMWMVAMALASVSTQGLSGLDNLLPMGLILILVLIVSMALGVLGNAYHLNGTVFPNPITPPGLFKSPSGSWIQRNARAALALGVLFIGTLPLVIQTNPAGTLQASRPLLDAFHHSLQGHYTTTRLVMALQRYQAPTVAEVIQRLPIGEVLLLKQWDAVSQREAILAKQAAHYLERYPGAWVTLMLDSAFLGHVQAVWSLLWTFVQGLVLPVGVLGLVCLALLGRALPRYRADLEALKAPISDWEGYVHRLEHSRVPLAREHLWLGVHATEDYPILLHRDILGEHAHLLGDSGSGKTALGMAPLLTQVIRDPEAAVVVIDLKGDMPLFQTARAEAGSRFKFFTNEVGKATHVFNPFGPLSSEHISLNQVCEVFLSALGLDHGEGYGRSYYSRVARNLLARTLHQYPDIASFEELRQKVGSLTDTLSDERDAFELIAVVESLAAVPQLNPAGQEAIAEHGIDMAQVLREREVVYFWLPAAIETASVREIAKIALYTLFTSAYQHQRLTRENARVWVFVDEFQHVASLNFKLLLQQARGMGMGLILANQTHSDLWTQDIDLRGTVRANTRFKQIFSVSDPQEREELSRASGETLYFNERIDASGAFRGAQGRVGPRLMANDLMALSDEPETSLAIIGRGLGYSQFGGYAVPVRGRYHITLEEYRRRKQAPWPEPGPHTLVAGRKRRVEVSPAPADLQAAFILVEGEAPPEVSEKVSASPWAQHLQSLHEARSRPGPTAAATE